MITKSDKKIVKQLLGIILNRPDISGIKEKHINVLYKICNKDQKEDK